MGVFLRTYGLQSVGMVGDELEDLSILSEIVESPNPFASRPGEVAALDQARLPFYLTALACWLRGGGGLRLARYVSVLFALLVLVVVFLLGRELFDARVGLIASGLQAVSIYDIGFSRLAITSSSSLFVALFLISLLLFYKAFTTRRLCWYWLTGVTIGLSIGAKLFGVFTLVIVGLWMFLWSAAGGKRLWHLVPRTVGVRRLLLGNGACLVVFGLLLFFNLGAGIELALFLLTAFATIVLHAVIIPGERGSLTDETQGVAVLGIVTLAVIYFFISSPVHLNARHLLAAFDVFPQWHQGAYADTAIWDYVSILLVRLNVPFNLLWVGALAYAVAYRRRPQHKLLLLAFGIPFVVLSLFRFKVTWYLMMVFPVGYLMISVLMRQGWRLAKQRGPMVRRLVVGVATALTAWYVVQMASIYPYYEIDGYRLGRSFIGWSKPAFVSFEGLPAAVDWMDHHLPDGSQVACLIIDLPRYNRYAHYHVEWYQRNPAITYHLAQSLEEAVGVPFVATSLYSSNFVQELESYGYRRVKTFWLLDLEYGRLHALPDYAEKIR